MSKPSPGSLWTIFTVAYRLGMLSAVFFIAYFLWSTKPVTYGEFRSDPAHRKANLDRAAVVQVGHSIPVDVQNTVDVGVQNTVDADVQNTVDVDVKNTVDVEVGNTVDVQGRVSIER
jgi:hypothetical protein